MITRVTKDTIYDPVLFIVLKTIIYEPKKCY